MAKDRHSVICNGRSAFYASIYDDLRNAAMDCGWALGLHGSLASDMDIMAMPWVEEAVPADNMIKNLESCFSENKLSQQLTHKSGIGDKPNNRVVYTIHIFKDFYLDINVIETS